MLIRITKDLTDIPENMRPYKDRVYEVVDTIAGKYRPNDNYRHVIEVKRRQISIAPDEYKVVRI